MNQNDPHVAHKEPHMAHKEPHVDQESEPHVALCEPRVALCEPHMDCNEPHVARREPDEIFFLQCRKFIFGTQFAIWRIFSKFLEDKQDKGKNHQI